jgi:hypothetical protein
MVIPVCFKCQNPVKVRLTPHDGLEIISYHCLDCNISAASFLLGYIEPELDDLPEEDIPTVNDDEIERAKYFKHNDQRYKLRAKMQGLKQLRANTDTHRKSSPNSTEGAASD